MIWILTVIINSMYANQVSFQEFKSEKQCQVVAQKISAKLSDGVTVFCEHE